MDYSQFQVKYINTPEFYSKIPELESYEPIDISSIQYNNAEADSPTSLLQDNSTKVIFDDKPQQINPVKRTLSMKPSKRLSNFNLYYDQAQAQDKSGQLASRRNLFTKLAYQESGLRHYISNSGGVPAFGYFQFMQGNYRGRNYNNVSQFAKTDLNTFMNSPIVQIQAANNLANYFLNSFSKVELQKLHQMGYSDSAIIAGAWLGGPGGVRAYAFKNQNRKDANGTGVAQYMQQFNNL